MICSPYFLAILPFLPSVLAKGFCKCLPGDSCFPSESELNLFSNKLSQPVIRSQRPLASVCYESSPNHDEVACAQLLSAQYDPQLRASASNALQWVNWESYITNSTIQGCSLQSNGTKGLCFQGRVPSYSVNVTTVSDIQETIAFAGKYNLRLVVKNTGHEFMGRAFGVGALEIFMHNMQGINFTDNFIPFGAAHFTTGQNAVTIGAGVQWSDLYTLAEQHNRSIPGGWAYKNTVGAGAGWLLGGGHSVLSPYYGLGVDNVLEINVVLPNASFVTANNYVHHDLFWALRGGGGPSFGVVTSLTYKTYPSIPYTGVYYSASANSSESYRQLLQLWIENHNSVADAGWSGAWPFLDNSLYLTLIAQGTPPYNHSADPTLDSFITASMALPGVNVTLSVKRNYSSFQEWNTDNLVDTSTTIGFNFTAGNQAGVSLALSSWILPRSLFEANSTQLVNALIKIPFGNPFIVGGGVVASVDQNSSSAAPAWRTSISDLSVYNFYDISSSNASSIQLINEETHALIEPLRALAPPPTGAQYLNEPDVLEADWQTAYWGWNYPRLLSIKKEIDPNDLLIVYKGVNSEYWDEQILCKTTVL